MDETITNDFISQEIKKDPHTFYARLRSTEPLSYAEGLNAWVVTTYEDALFVFERSAFY